jgi:hypothetical protein
MHSRIAPIVGGIAASLILGIAPASAQTSPNSGWTPGPDASQNTPNSFTGFIDSPSSGASVPTSGGFSVNGWFVDTTAQGWAGADDVQLFLGQMGNGGTMLAKGTVGQSRPDVATALGNPYWASSGFSVSVATANLPAGSATLGLYVHTPGKGWWYEPLNVNASATAPASSAGSGSSTATGVPQVTVSDPTEGQNISTRNGDHTISGSVSSPGASAADIDRIEVWINGERDSGTLLGTTTPQSDGSWSVTFTPTHFASTHSNIYVYAHSKSTGKETEILRGFNITDK